MFTHLTWSLCHFTRVAAEADHRQRCIVGWRAWQFPQVSSSVKLGFISGETLFPNLWLNINVVSLRSKATQSTIAIKPENRVMSERSKAFNSSIKSCRVPKTTIIVPRLVLRMRYLCDMVEEVLTFTLLLLLLYSVLHPTAYESIKIKVYLKYQK